MSNAGAMGSGAECQTGTVRCNAEFKREKCDEAGSWNETEFVCARAVTVDDELGGYCVTKGDGSYRCAGVDYSQELPEGRYMRVQTSAAGLIGLTEDGKLIAPELKLPLDLPEVASFRATNMWGDIGICPLLRDGRFALILPNGNAGNPESRVMVEEGTFATAFCAFEGWRVGIRQDGTIWSPRLAPPLGSEWKSVTFSNTIFCALGRGGAIECVPSEFSCNWSANLCSKTPNFTGSGYKTITATANAACALTDEGALECQRHDGTPMLSDPGPYTSIEGGHALVCAIRLDGSVACFRHDGDAYPLVDAGHFAAFDPGLGQGW